MWVWNNNCTIAFARKRNIEYIDDVVKTILNTLITVPEKGRLSIDAAEVLVDMFAISLAEQGLEDEPSQYITKPDELMKLITAFNQSLPMGDPDKKKVKPTAQV